MPPDIIWTLWTSIVTLAVATASLAPQLSCRRHYLSNHQHTGVYPIGNEISYSNIVCHMPDSYDGEDTVISTEIHSGLEKGHTVMDRRSVNYQLSDLLLLRDIVRSSICDQTLSVQWNQSIVEKHSVTFVSLLNESTTVDYDEDHPMQTIQLSGSKAGIRHILPLKDGIRGPTVTSGSLMCRQRLIPQPECLTSQRSVSLSAPSSLLVLSFRTDRSDQNLLSLHSKTAESATVKLENDFFLRVDSGPSMAIGQLSDSSWHTVVVAAGPDEVRITVDGRDIPMEGSGIKDARVTRVDVELEGEVMVLSDSEEDRCAEGESSEGTQELSISQLCSGCDCTILPNSFQWLPAPSCTPNDDDGFQLLRDADRLSFLLLREAFQVPPTKSIDIRVAMSFQSDSDAGLLMFGYWHNQGDKGRFQVHYSGSTTSAVLCRNDGQETCMACSIKSEQAIGSSKWHRLVLHAVEEEVFMVVDKSVCRLTDETRHEYNRSTAEIYAIPTSSEGSGLFIGGTYYEKKRAGLYQTWLEQNYFENTREKIPSLRGCVKDVFAAGNRVDLSEVYKRQMESTLLEKDDLQAYAILIGCSSCSPACPDGVRCRSPAPIRGSSALCDCSDWLEVQSQKEETCHRRITSPIPLSTLFVNTPRLLIPLETNKALLSKIWLKFRLPLNIRQDALVAEFNSHREVILRISSTKTGLIRIESHPHDALDMVNTVEVPYSPSDDRVHLVSISRRTPLGTRHSARKYDIQVDGFHFELAEMGKAWLNNVSLPVANGLNEEDSVVIHDLGVGYDYDEHMFLSHPTNRIHQVDIHARIMPFLYRTPKYSKCGTLDPYLWETTPENAELSDTVISLSPEVVSLGGASSSHGSITEYTPAVYEPQLLLSARWLFYSLLLGFLLCLLCLVFLCLYCCVLRRKGRSSSNASDRERMMRDSPDYMPVKMRRESGHSLSRSFDCDGSLGTDDTDLNAYRDIPSHRVKIYRESMVSILVPSMDEPCEAALVRRYSGAEPTQEKSVSDWSASAPTSPPPTGSPAPLVSVTEEEQ